MIVPSESSRFLYVIAPLLSLIPALAAWAVIPLNDTFVIADINAGLLYVLALTSVGVYGVILAGWATNSKYALLGAMRSAAQIVAYEIAMGFALVGVLMASGSLNIGDIVRAQSGGFSNWFLLPLFPLGRRSPESRFVPRGVTTGRCLNVKPDTSRRCRVIRRGVPFLFSSLSSRPFFLWPSSPVVSWPLCCSFVLYS